MRFFESGRFLRTKRAFAMVFFIKVGFDRVTEKAKKAKMKRCGATFCILGPFRDRCEEGVRVIIGSKLIICGRE